MSKKNGIKPTSKKSSLLSSVESMPVAPVVISTEVTEETAEDGTIVEITKSTATTDHTAEPIMTFGLGRPVDPNSARQKRLLEKEMKVIANGGKVTLGRPPVPGSASSVKKAELEARKAEGGYVAKRGRPVDTNSPRQQELAKKNERAIQRVKDMQVLAEQRKALLSTVVTAPAETIAVPAIAPVESSEAAA